MSLGELGRNAFYFQGAGALTSKLGEQAHTVGFLGSPAKKPRKNQGFGEIRALLIRIKGAQTPCGGLNS